MNLSERAAELALKYFPQYGNGAIRDSLSTDIESLAADAANLARGLAIEQVAQHFPLLPKGSARWECSCGWKSKYGEPLMGQFIEHIRSLDPDAAQALAAHDAENYKRALWDRDNQWCESLFNEQGLGVHTDPIGGRKILNNMLETERAQHGRLIEAAKFLMCLWFEGPEDAPMPTTESVLEEVVSNKLREAVPLEPDRFHAASQEHDAEIERRARLDGQIFEAKLQSHNWYGWYIHSYQDDCRDCKHIKELEAERAALVKSQPAPAKEIERLQNMPDSEIDTSDIPEVTDWSKAERGKFYRGPAPAREGEQ